MKKYLFILVSILFVIVANAQTPLQAKKLPWIKFIWDGDSVGHRYFDKADIQIPVQIDNLPYKFEAQFDLGAMSTMLYGNTFAPYLSINKSIQNKIDTSSVIWINSQQNPTLKGVDIKLDNIDLGKKDIALYKNYGDSMTLDSVKTNSIKEIGTIGADFLQKKILIIDYPNQRICIVNKIPDYLKKSTDFVDILIEDGLVKVPCQIGDKKEYLIFDTGSSLFGLATSEKNTDEIAGINAPIADSICAYSWGNYSCSYGKETKMQVKIGKNVMPKTLVYYDKVTKSNYFNSLNHFYDKEHVWGITGNVFFLNDIVIVDFKNKKIGIYRLPEKNLKTINLK